MVCLWCRMAVVHSLFSIQCWNVNIGICRVPTHFNPAGLNTVNDFQKISLARVKVERGRKAWSRVKHQYVGPLKMTVMPWFHSASAQWEGRVGGGGVSAAHSCAGNSAA